MSESFFATLEKELLALQPLQSRSKTRQQVAEYIDNYYNLVRLHSHLDYVSPIEFDTNAQTRFKQSNLSAESGQLQLASSQRRGKLPRHRERGR